MIDPDKIPMPDQEICLCLISLVWYDRRCHYRIVNGECLLNVQSYEVIIASLRSCVLGWVENRR